MALPASPLCWVVETWQRPDQKDSYNYSHSQDLRIESHCLQTQNELNLLSNDHIYVRAHCQLAQFPNPLAHCQGENQYRVWVVTTEVQLLSK